MLQRNIDYFNISLVRKVLLPSRHLSPSKNCFVSLQSPEAELPTADVQLFFMFRSSLHAVLEPVGGLAVPGGLEAARGSTLADRDAQIPQQPQYCSTELFKVSFFHCTLLQIVTCSMQ